MHRATDRVRFRVNANGAEVFVGGKWFPADSQVLNNVTTLLKEGLPDRPELAVN